VEKDAYSAFEGTELGDLLEQRRVSSVLVGGLATDYCVLNTTLDAIRRGHRTYLLTDACRAVNVNEGDGDAALSKMFDAGAIALTTTSVEEG
jgi:nicotinamidase/pyrazinamidase